MVTLLGTSGSSAAAENTFTYPLASEVVSVLPAAQPLISDAQPSSEVNGAIQPVPVQALSASSAAAPTPPAIASSSLEKLVATQVDSSELTGNMKCLAGAIYFEARSESLEGQLAVGRVIVARTQSGRFPASYCGVVYQPSQFSFIRGAAMPSVDAQSNLWHRAVALAKIADAGSWQSPAEGALFFHAARVNANWRMKRVAQIDHHVFYR
jgi:N-acetylmuramoyl-L-alanine amidase